MKKYVLSRLIRSIVSIMLVTTIAYIMVFSLVPRREIFASDLFYNKLKGNPDELINYENIQYEKNGYIDYYSTANLCLAVGEGSTDNSAYRDCIAGDRAGVDAWGAKNSAWVIEEMPISKAFYATREIGNIERVGRFYANFIRFDHPWNVNDPSNPDLSRGLGVSADSNVGLAVTCSGCESKNLLYLNTAFPFIHQNIIKFNLGESYPTFQGQEVLKVISSSQGKPVSKPITFPTGRTANSPLNLGSCTYKPTSQLDHLDKERFTDNYANCITNNDGPSMLMTSAITGVIAVILAYVIGVPMGVAMARKKGKVVDRMGVAIITVLISVPSLAFVYFFRFLGTQFFGLPGTFPQLGATNPLTYVLPTLILALLNLATLVIWVRRYMIDQQTADYVKFAKAKGLSDKEISRHHIFRNAIIPIANGIPSSIIMAIAGATITESIFLIPGMGKMLPDAIIGHNNNMVIALVFVFTTISIIAVFLGDVLIAKIDPRINLVEKGGK